MQSMRAWSWMWAASYAALAHTAPPPGEGFIDVPGGPVWYKVTGDGAGVPLLVLHGGPGGTSCDFSLLEPLGPERPVVRYDQLGSGRSGRPSDRELWRVERFVEELHVLRRELGLSRLHLLGSSWGGSLAAAYVLEKGSEGIVSLTLSSPLLSTRDWMEDANALRAGLPAEIQATLARHEAAGTLDSPEYAAATEAFYHRHVDLGVGPEPDSCEGAPWNQAIYEYMWGPTEFRATGTLLDFDLTTRLGALVLPVLLIAGEHDEARPARLESYRERIPGAKLVVIEDAAHATLAAKPEPYRRILESFLDSAETR
jgi:proline iminopeptidase